jgi:hypothetical protein
MLGRGVLDVKTNLLEITVTAVAATVTLTLIASTANAHPLATAFKQPLHEVHHFEWPFAPQKVIG